MRYALAALLLAACAANPTVMPDAAPCGGVCGAGTACVSGACVPVDAGAPDAPALDSGEDVADVVTAADVALDVVALDVVALDVVALDVAALDVVALDVASDAGFDSGAADVASDAGFDAGAPDVPLDVPCVAPRAMCSNGCRSISVDTTNCGACGVACPRPPGAGERCVGGVCGFECRAGFANCDGNAANGCEVDTNTTVANCGACGTVCRPGQGCSVGRCYGCETPLSFCGGSCMDLRTDVRNCGRCERVCASIGGGSVPACVAGDCTLACDGAHANCDGNAANGCETFIGTRTNCGGCGVACPGTLTCDNIGTGAAPVFQCGCSRSLLFAACGGDTCFYLPTSGTNCGACGNACGPTERCNGGVCESCGPSSGGGLRVRCGDVCVDLASSELNCGACGYVCTGGRYCGNGTCRG